MKKSILFNKNSNLNFTKILFAALIAGSVMFASCSPDSSDNNKDDKTYEEKLAEEKAKKEKEEEAAAKAALPGLYEKVIGSWEPKYPYNFSGTWRSVAFNSDSVVLDGEPFSIRVPDDLLTVREFNAISGKNYDGGFAIKTSSNFIFIKPRTDYIFIYYYTAAPEYVSDAPYVKSSASGSGEGEGAGSGSGNVSADLKGTYSYKPSGANQYNASITLNDNGTWTYSTEKSYSSISGGTYTVSGDKVTLKLTTPYTMEETFTVTNSGTSSTWKSDENGSSTLFPVLFGVAGTEITFTKS